MIKKRISTMLTGIFAFTLFGAASHALAVPTIYTVGDSTVQTYTSGYYPRAGWGQMLPYFLDASKIGVVNKAVGGTSSKSFYDSYWAGVKANIKPGDYVTIGFGINDSAADTARHTVPFTTFKDYLTKFVNETKALGAYPILVATQPRNAWTPGNPPTVYAAYHDYPVASRQLAGELNVPLIDLDQRGIALMQSVGQQYATNFMYNYYLPGEWSNYPNGNADAVHFQEAGATELAKMVIAGIRSLSTDANISKIIPAIKPTYKVTFTSNNSAAGQITRTESFPAGIKVTAYARPYAGFTFTGWSGSISGTVKNTVFTMGAADRTITASFSGAPVIYQAESAVLGGGTISETSNTGFNGASYVNFPTTGGTLTFNNVNGGAGGSRALRLRYALGAADRTGQLVVNGGAASNITFYSTGAFTTWQFLDVVVTLAAGSANTIVLKSTGADLANIDEMTVR